MKWKCSKSQRTEKYVCSNHEAPKTPLCRRLFKHIHQKLLASDIPKCLRSVDKTVLATALASAQQTGMSDVATYLLEFMSKRMADNLRKEITELGKVKASEGETAMKEIMIEIRRLIDAGEVEIIIPSDEDETETFET